jgi:Raf kinase inhibitor-like YbhB/YbcL family protein
MMISLKSPAFANGETIPFEYTQEGDNISPPLQWSGVASDVRQFTLICEDPDASSDHPFVHWLIYDIPASVSALPQGIHPRAEIPAPVHARQGLNEKKQIGYMGPKPPVSDDWHRYRFVLYALDRELSLKAGATRDELEAAMSGHIVAETELVRKYHPTKRLQEAEPKIIKPKSKVQPSNQARS